MSAAVGPTERPKLSGESRAVSSRLRSAALDKLRSRESPDRPDPWSLDLRVPTVIATAGSCAQPTEARSSYDRGMEEVHDLLDLLWGFREPLHLGGDDEHVHA